jgi:hypothetical protein
MISFRWAEVSSRWSSRSTRSPSRRPTSRRWGRPAHHARPSRRGGGAGELRRAGFRLVALTNSPPNPYGMSPLDHAPGPGEAAAGHPCPARGPHCRHTPEAASGSPVARDAPRRGPRDGGGRRGPAGGTQATRRRVLQSVADRGEPREVIPRGAGRRRPRPSAGCRACSRRGGRGGRHAREDHPTSPGRCRGARRRRAQAGRPGSPALGAESDLMSPARSEPAPRPAPGGFLFAIIEMRTDDDRARRT